MLHVMELFALDGPNVLFESGDVHASCKPSELATSDLRMAPITRYSRADYLYELVAQDERDRLSSHLGTQCGMRRVVCVQRSFLQKRDSHTPRALSPALELWLEEGRLGPNL